MKKLFLLLSLVFMFAACGGSKTAEEKVYIIGTNAEYPPFESVQDGKIVGIDADIIEEAAKRMGIKYKWNDMTFDGLIPALQTKKVDAVIAGMSITPERAKAVNFSVPYLTSNVSIITNNIKPIKDINDLENKSYGVELGTTKEAAARKIPGAEVVPFSSTTAALVALKAGKVDGMVLDESVSEKYVENNPELILVGTLEGEPKAIAFNKEDTEFTEKFSKAIEEMMEDGTIAALREKYNI